MSIVELWFKKAYAQDDSRPPDMRIPRAYIASASPNFWPNPKIVPDQAVVTSLSLWIATDTGEALPVAEERLSVGGKIPREKYTTVDVYAGFPVAEKYVPPRPDIPPTWDLPYDPDGYYRKPSAAGLQQISSCAPPSRQIAEKHCSYYAQLAKNLTVVASFSNLTAMGGIPYAERELLKIKAVVCKFMTCVDQ